MFLLQLPEMYFWYKVLHFNLRSITLVQDGRVLIVFRKTREPFHPLATPTFVGGTFVVEESIHRHSGHDGSSTPPPPPVRLHRHITITKRLRWRGPNRPGDRGAATFVGGGKWSFGAVWWGLDRGAFCDRAGELDRAARSPPSTHNNQRVAALVRLELTGGSRGSFVLRRGKINFLCLVGVG